MRKVLTFLAAVIILIGSGYIAIGLVKKKKKKAVITPQVIQTAFVTKVKNRTIPIHITENGRLIAKNRLEVYAEVQGVMETTPKDFKAGTHYRKGEVLVKIRNNDYYANLQAQKSVLQNLITSILPDLRMDYPEAYEKWDNYLQNFDMNKPVRKLPEPSSKKEKFFITGKNIYTTYYNTKNLEIILEKYTIRAPFHGILTEALVTPGTVVRPGQKLGEFIDPSIYELEVAISKTMMSDLVVGKKVIITSPDQEGKSWTGKISRINGKVNLNTQTINVYIEVKAKDLREGMYMEAQIEAKPKTNAYEISRNLLVDDDKLFVVQDSTLQAVQVNILHKSNRTIIVHGLEDNSLVVSRPIPGAYAGMKVATKIIEEQE